MLGVITALSFENQGIMDRVSIIEKKVVCGIEFVEALVGENRIIIASCGEGKVNAARCAQIMISVFCVTQIINIGVGGALSDAISAGDLVVATDTVQHDFDMTAIRVPRGLVPSGVRSLERPWGDKAEVYYKCDEGMVASIEENLVSLGVHYVKGVIATGDMFISSNTYRNYLQKTFNAIVCDMEGAAIAHVCKSADVGFAEVRKISDSADENASNSYLEYKRIYSIEDIAIGIIRGILEGKYGKH